MLKQKFMNARFPSDEEGIISAYRRSWRRTLLQVSCTSRLAVDPKRVDAANVSAAII
jgi:hypothetical protein